MAPSASRRFHEAGVGSRTGLRLSAVARDQDGFENLEEFFKASKNALDNGRQEESDADDADDYDSFDETHFSRRSGVGASKNAQRLAASSSSAMDIQTSSAPSPRSMLSRPASSYASSPPRNRKSRMHAAYAAPSDDDDDDDDADIELPNLSTASRSFDLGGMAGDDDVDLDDRNLLPAPSAPAGGLSARQARAGAEASSTAKKAKKPIHRPTIELSDSEDDRLLVGAFRRLQRDDENASDYDAIPPIASPARKKKTAAPTPKSPARPTKAAAATNGAPQRNTVPPTQTPAADDQPPKRKRGRPPKERAAQPPPAQEPSFTGDASNFLPDPSPSQPPQAEPPVKRKRGRPPKDRSAESNVQGGPQSEEGRKKAAKQKSASRSADGGAAKSRKAGAKEREAEVVQRVRPQVRDATVFDENGVRRGTRQRFAPLEYWRGERIRYGRPSLPNEELRSLRRPGEDDFEDSLAAMPQRRRVPVLDIKEVIRVPRAPGEGTFSGTRAHATRRRPGPPSTAPRKGDDKAKRPSRTPEAEEEWMQLDPTADTVHVEDGWDHETVETGLVVDDEDGEEVEMSVVRTRGSLHPVAAANQQFRFEKVFNCGGLMATGVLELPPGTRKPTKPSKDNSFVFCVLQGALRATVHRKSFIVGPHGVFQVPAGNTYALENICQRDVHLFFAQCRKTKKAGVGDLTTFTQASDTSYSLPAWPAGRPILQSRGGESASPEVQPQSKRIARDAESDADSEEDDFESSRTQKAKKRIFRKL